MDTNNIINIDDLDKPVYRIFPLKRVQELFTNKELVLVNPSKWDDPFENFLLTCSGVTDDGTLVSLQSLADSWFGQCWTTNSDTDAMWRIYSGDQKSVRVKTTIRKLAEALLPPGDQFASQNRFIGKVQYYARERIEDFLSSTSFFDISLGGQCSGFAETLLTKRQEFEHESEVRILSHEPETTKARSFNGFYRVPIDPLKLIDELCFDPRLTDEAQIRNMTQTLKATGFPGPINQSELYKLKITTIPLSPKP